MTPIRCKAFAFLFCLLTLAPFALAQDINLNGKWDGIYADKTKSPYVWKVTMTGPTQMAFEDVGGSGTKFSGTLSGNTITDSNGHTGTVGPQRKQIFWQDGTLWRLEPGTQTAYNPPPPPPRQVVRAVPSGPARAIHFTNDAAYVATMTVTYIPYNQTTPTSTTTDNIVATQGATVSVPFATAPGQPINIALNAIGTVKKGVYFGTLPDNFTSSPQPCFHTAGTIFTPTGGPCGSASTPATVSRTITFKNTAGYIASMSVTYQAKGGVRNVNTDNLSLGQSQTLQVSDISSGAFSIVITGTATIKNPVLTTTINSGFTGDKCYSASGTIFSASAGPC